MIGEKSKQKCEEKTRIVANQQAAGASYTPPEPGDLGPDEDPAGLPWGSLSMRHVVETGNAKERESRRASREASASVVQSTEASGAMEGIEGTENTAR